jgi:hypothetical protein
LSGVQNSGARRGGPCRAVEHQRESVSDIFAHDEWGGRGSTHARPGRARVKLVDKWYALGGGNVIECVHYTRPAAAAAAFWLLAARARSRRQRCFLLIADKACDATVRKLVPPKHTSPTDNLIQT